MGDTIRKILFIIIAVSVLYFCYTNALKDSITLNNDFYLMDYFSNVKYVVKSDNVGITQINALNNVYHNLLLEGYELVDISKDDRYIDAKFANNELKYRYIYDLNSNTLYTFSSDFENSSVGVKYVVTDFQ